MINIAIFSSNRADLSFLYNLCRLFEKNNKYKVKTILSETSKIDFRYIKRKNIIQANLKNINTGRYNLIKILSKLLNKYTKLLAKIKPKYLIIVGDRYESFAMTIVCNFLNIKIIHIAGGDITKGAYDDEIRTYISKSSYINFVTNDESKKNLKNLIKDNSKIFDYGSPSLDYIKEIRNVSKKEISQRLNLSFNKNNILVTFHPETKYLNSTLRNLKNLLASLISLGNEYNIYFTGSNIDTFGKIFNKTIKDTVNRKNNFYFFSNLGSENYIQLAKNCDIIIGNSSSIVYEMPFLGLKSILVGRRQDGRFMSNKITKIEAKKKTIIKTIKKIIRKKNPKKELKTFGNGNSSKKIFKKIHSLINDK